MKCEQCKKHVCSRPGCDKVGAFLVPPPFASHDARDDVMLCESHSDHLLTMTWAYIGRLYTPLKSNGIRWT